MRVPREILDSLISNLDSLSQATQQVLRQQLLGINWESIEDLREQIIAILNPMVDAATIDAAAYSCDFYDMVREYSIGEGYTSRPYPQTNLQATDEVVRALVGDVNNKGMEWLVNQLLARADWEIRQASNRSIVENGRRDPAEIRWARIPHSANPCWYCAMVASNGFFYRSADSAMKTHSHCKCTVAPGFEGLTEIEGYDPDHYYQLFGKALDDGVVTYGKLNEMSAEAKRKHSMDEVTDAQRIKYRDLQHIRDLMEQNRPIAYDAPSPTGQNKRFYVYPDSLRKTGGGFNSKLGFDQSQKDQQAYELISRSRGHSFKDKGDGVYEQDIRMAGPNGKKARVRLTWLEVEKTGSMVLDDMKVGRYI